MDLYLNKFNLTTFQLNEGDQSAKECVKVHCGDDESKSKSMNVYEMIHICELQWKERKRMRSSQLRFN